jgi:GDP-L-fucose synthase
VTKLFIAGHRGMVGSALVRRFKKEPGFELLLRDRAELDLTNAVATETFLAAEKPDVAIIAAAKVGGIHANSTFPAEFLHVNLAIASSTIHGAHKAGVRRLLFLGSSCIYPKLAQQPIREDSLLTAELEPTNEAYAIAKIAGVKLCEYYRKEHKVVFHSAMPTNLYGPGDSYNLMNSHVLPALIRKFHEARETGAREVVAWGTGTPRREFLHVDDMADACHFLIGQKDPPDLVNVGTGTDVTIRELTGIVAEATGYRGAITWDASKPDGTPQKLLDVSRMSALGWKARVALREGIGATYASFLEEKKAGTLRV